MMLAASKLTHVSLEILQKYSPHAQVEGGTVLDEWALAHVDQGRVGGYGVILGAWWSPALQSLNFVDFCFFAYKMK